MQKQREIFINGATKMELNQNLLNNYSMQMVNSAEYCFNQSQCIWRLCKSSNSIFKAANPVEYMAALLTANSGIRIRYRNRPNLFEYEHSDRATRY